MRSPPLAPLLMAAGALATLLNPGGTPGARAELAPWVYGEQQRQAPLVVRLQVIRAAPVDGSLEARCRVQQVLRQPPQGQLRVGQFLELRYPLPTPHQPGFVGPSPLPLLKPGERVTAWLAPIPGTYATYTPAAGGRSFGPSMEGSFEPRIPR